MRECALCGEPCDSSLGFYRELKTQFWGGAKDGTITYSPKLVSFFCSEEHRAEGESGPVGGELDMRAEIIDDDFDV